MNLLPYYATQSGANLPKYIEHLIDFQTELLAGAVTPQQHPHGMDLCNSGPQKLYV